MKRIIIIPFFGLLLALSGCPGGTSELNTTSSMSSSYFSSSAISLYTLTYDANGATGGSVPIDTNHYTNGQTVTVADNSGGLYKNYYAFAGWTNTSGTSISNTFIMGNGDVVLYAVWTNVAVYTVTYIGNGGSPIPTDTNQYTNGQLVQVNNGNTILSNGFAFNGWTNASGVNISNSFTMGNDNVSLYATWDWAVYEIGQQGPAGGWIFYINPNFGTDGWKYLEAAPTNQNLGSGIAWSSNLIDITSANRTNIGEGKQNTIEILAADNKAYAAIACTNYMTTNGSQYFNDWFLPSQLELGQMYSNLAYSTNGNIGGFTLGEIGYWSSTETANNSALRIIFSDGRWHANDKRAITTMLRAIRSF